VNDAAVERLRWAAFDRLRRRMPVSAAELSGDLDTPVAAIEEALAAQAAVGRVELDEHGDVIGAHGITLLTTRHTFAVSNATVNTWCALDAVGIPAAAGDDATVTTSCGHCGERIMLTIAAGEPTECSSVVLWLPTAPCDNLRLQFCPHANLFCDRRHLVTWHRQAGEPDGRVLTLAETAAIGRQSWRRDTDTWGAGIEAARPTHDQEIRMQCSCCGQERVRLVALQCHDDIQVCPDCIGWLRSKAGVLDVTPILPVRDMAEAIVFYQAAGFTTREYEPNGGYTFVHHNDDSVFDLDLVERPLDPATNPAGCYVIVPDVDDWHTRLTAAGLPVTALADQPWGMREFTLTDPSGNHLRIGQSV
jgi:uncharacterized glyoxalase superfamily protein PhnB